MKKLIERLALQTLLITAAALALPGADANAKINVIEVTQRTAEAHIRNLLEPLLNKYCNEECKLMSVNVTVDIADQDQLSPGFDDVDPVRKDDLAPSAATVKLLIDEKVGPVSRGKLLDLLQQFLDTLDYPVKINSQVSHFPQPIGSSGKVAELRDKVAKQFRATVDELFQQFCPGQCMLADFTLKTETVNPEEAQYGSQGEFVQDSGTAIRITDLSATLLMDESIAPDERANILEMAKLKTNYFKNVNLTGKALKFPTPNYDRLNGISGKTGTGLGGKTATSATADSKSEKKTENNSQSSKTESTNSNSSNSSNSANSNTNSTTSNTAQSNESNNRQERFERFEKIERVESGDAVQAELQKFKVYGLIFGCSILSLLIFMAMASFRPKGSGGQSVHKIIQSLASDPVSNSAPSTFKGEAPSNSATNEERTSTVVKRYEIERLIEELMSVFAQQPKVAKHVFTRVLTEEGVEATAQYISIFGESIVIDMLRDPSLQSDVSELMEFYAKNVFELTDDEKLDLLRTLHNRTIAGKLVVMGNRSSNQFDFLSDMDGMQILELVRTESLTVKAIVLTQCDPQKRATVYAQLEETTRMSLLTELSRIDYLPRDYISNVANALKRKRRENPKLNTEALPGSEVLVSLLERTGPDMQRTVVKSLDSNNPDSARVIKAKLVSIDTLRYLRDNQLLEVILSLKHDELLQFLKGAPAAIKNHVFAKSPKELIVELEEELVQISVLSRESYQAIERKVLNRMKMMANEGLINLVEVNERMFADAASAESTGFIEAGPPGQRNAA